jgi:hypothetical protein
LEDCLITSPENVIQIQDKISRCYVEADGIEATTYNKGIREVRITAALSKAKDVGMKIAKDSMSSNNNLLSTVLSGSKGDFFNIAQLTGLLGQQNLLGKRVQPTLNNGKRTLPHYPFGKLDKEVEYESRGFIRHSFIEGLNPQEFFFTQCLDVKVFVIQLWVRLSLDIFRGVLLKYVKIYKLRMMDLLEMQLIKFINYLMETMEWILVKQ